MARLRVTTGIVLLALGCLLAVMTWTGGTWSRQLLPRSGVEARLLVRPGAPFVIVLPGYHLPPQFVDDPALEFYRRGFSVATLDLNRSSRPEQAVAELIEVLPEPVGIFAHSGAVTPTATAAAGNERVGGVVLLGFHPGGGKNRAAIPNVMLAFGTFDDSLNLTEQIAALKDTGGPAVSEPGIQVGDFGQGTARELFLSSYSQHGGEPFDPVLQAAGARWLSSALRWKAGSALWPAGLWHVGVAMLGVALALLAPARALPALTLAALWASLVLHPLGPWSFALTSLGRQVAPILALRHTAALFLGVQVALALAYIRSEPRPDSWLHFYAAVQLYQWLYLPSQAAGLAAAWQSRLALPFWECLATLGLLQLLLPRLRDWLERWTRTCDTAKPAVLAGAAFLLSLLARLWLPAWALFAALVYLLLVRLSGLPAFARARPGVCRAP